MSNLRLYNVTISNDVQQRLPRNAQRRLESLGLLDADTPVTEAIAGEPGTRNIHGQYRGKYAEKLAAELEELVGASGYGHLPLYGIDRDTPIDGYYAGESSEVSPLDPREDSIQEFRVTVQREGSRETHWRGVETEPYQPDPGHTFGNDTSALIAIPAVAGNVRWYDGESTSDATTVDTVTTELGDVDRYDATATPTDGETLVFDVELDETWPTACLVWDTRGHANRTDADDVVQWQRRFATDAAFSGDAVIENGRLRLTITKPDAQTSGTLSAERYSSGSWSSVSLPASDWSPQIVDFDTLAPMVTRGHVEFINTSTSERYALDMALHRGHEDVLWTIPSGESDPIPTGLKDRLAPIASESVMDAQPEMTLVRRQEVR